MARAKLKRARRLVVDEHRDSINDGFMIIGANNPSYWVNDLPASSTTTAPAGLDSPTAMRKSINGVKVKLARR